VECVGHSKVLSPATSVLSMITPNNNIVDLYSFGHEDVMRTMCDMGVEVPFQHTLQLLGPQGEIVRVSALFDGCAMVAAMCISVFEKVKHRLGEWKRSEKRLRMGNGVIVPSMAVWKEKMKLGGATIEGEFEVFDSGGSWVFLLGKPLLLSFQAKQAYGPDTVSIRGRNTDKETLYKQIKKPRAGRDEPGVNLTLDVKQRDIIIGGSSETKPLLREVSNDAPRKHSNNLLTPQTPQCLLRQMNPPDPHKPERVKRILQEVTIGTDVTEDQRHLVQELLGEYADCFALALKEVNAIPGAVKTRTDGRGSLGAAELR
jgi:hypothetical protein